MEYVIDPYSIKLIDGEELIRSKVFPEFQKLRSKFKLKPGSPDYIQMYYHCIITGILDFLKTSRCVYTFVFYFNVNSDIVPQKLLKFLPAKIYQDSKPFSEIKKLLNSENKVNLIYKIQQKAANAKIGKLKGFVSKHKLKQLQNRVKDVKSELEYK